MATQSVWCIKLKQATGRLLIVEHLCEEVLSRVTQHVIQLSPLLMPLVSFCRDYSVVIVSSFCGVVCWRCCQRVFSSGLKLILRFHCSQIHSPSVQNSTRSFRKGWCCMRSQCTCFTVCSGRLLIFHTAPEVEQSAQNIPQFFVD